MKNKIILEGMLIPFTDKPNGNNHVYNKNCISNLNEFKKRANEGGVPGQFGYPPGEDFTKDYGDLDHPECKASHKTIDIELKEDGLIGKIEVLNNDEGNKILELLNGNNIVFRSRSVGHVDKDGAVIVDNIISFDAVKAEDDAFKGMTDTKLKKI